MTHAPCGRSLGSRLWAFWPEGRDVFPALVALCLATMAGMVLLTMKVAWSGRLRDLYLAWNLFLALLPLGLALLCVRWRPWATGASRLRFAGAAAAWMLFFPNAPYIFTDMIHLGPTWRTIYWVDLVLILLFAMTGFVAGFLSLYLMQKVVHERAGQIAGWGLVLTVAALSGTGVFVGRFLRWNSWDVLLRPWDLARDSIHLIRGGEHLATGLVFPVLFGAFVFTAYTLLYSLTHLAPVTPARATKQAQAGEPRRA